VAFDRLCQDVAMNCSLFLSAAAILACSSVGHACLWLHGTTIDGHYIQVEGSDEARFLEEQVGKTPMGMPSLFEHFEYRPDDPVARMNDSAVQVLLRGDARQAVVMLEEVEAGHPGRYYTAANLGTAYELAGDDVKALEWITEGIKRNPASHMRTEWLHARILEAKIALKSDPAWLRSQTITGADFKQLNDPGYILPTRQGELGREHLRDSLRAQLGVRVLFVKPKDAIVAQLLKELALAEAQVGLLQQALVYAGLAERYGLDPGALQTERAAWNETIRKTPPVTERERHSRALIRNALLVLGLCATALCAGIVFLLKRKKKKAPVA
jgi:hypothetical protein